MKFTLFALIAGFFLVAVSANATGDIFLKNELIEDMELTAQDLADELAEIEPYGLFTGMYTVIKRALRYVKGLNCTIKEVLAIENAAHNFVNSVAACGGQISQKAQNLVNACLDIIETCKAILGINESVCGNSNDVEETDSDAATAAAAEEVESFGVVSKLKTSHKCLVQMVRKVNKLKKQVKKVISMIKDIKKVPGDTSDCVMAAVNTLETTFTQFPANVKACSKLTS
uniref:Secreted protein n=1 Tax=Musca domestica TaxID=7370 RepID=A0A1I8N8W2_MUSDO